MLTYASLDPKRDRDENRDENTENSKKTKLDDSRDEKEPGVDENIGGPLSSENFIEGERENFGSLLPSPLISSRNRGRGPRSLTNQNNARTPSVASSSSSSSSRNRNPRNPRSLTNRNNDGASTFDSYSSSLGSCVPPSSEPSLERLLFVKGEFRALWSSVLTESIDTLLFNSTLLIVMIERWGIQGCEKLIKDIIDTIKTQLDIDEGDDRKKGYDLAKDLLRCSIQESLDKALRYYYRA